MSAEASEILPQYNWRTSKNYEKANLSALYSGLEVNFLVHWQSLASKISTSKLGDMETCMILIRWKVC